MRSTSAPRRQRLRGLLLVLVVAVAALVAAQLLHSPVAGSASRGPIPGPPAVGDCLLDPTSIQQHFQVTDLTYPWLRTGPCQGRRFGEVVAVLTKPDLPQSSTSTYAEGDPSAELCRAAIAGWLGLPTPGGIPVFGRWVPDLLAVAPGSVGAQPATARVRDRNGWRASPPLEADRGEARPPVTTPPRTTRSAPDRRCRCSLTACPAWTTSPRFSAPMPTPRSGSVPR